MDNRGEFLNNVAQALEFARCDLNRKQKMRRLTTMLTSGNLTNSSAVTRLFSLPAMLC